MANAREHMPNDTLHKRHRMIISHEKIRERCEIIKRMINDLQFFKDGIFFDYKLYEINLRDKPSLQVVFFINDIESTFCTTSYTANKSSQLDHAHIIFVRSVLGYSTGVFLLNIQLIMCYLSNILEVTLENYTDEPSRAAKGIYKRFAVNKRGHSSNDFIGKNLETQLHASEGEMRLTMNANVLKYIKSDLNNISEKIDIQSITNPWNPDYSKRLAAFLRNIGEHFTGGFRRKNTIRHRQTKNNRKSHRRTRK